MNLRELKRNNKLDIMRCIGIFLVILAHMEPPPWLLNTRTFDVVMLVMVSGMAYMYSPPTSFKKYVFKRLKKLLVPTYITITLIFGISFFVCAVSNRTQLFDMSTIARSYLFLNGIGYIWIVKVFLIIAIVAPLLKKAVYKIKNDYLFIGLVISTYVAYNLLYLLLKDSGIIVIDYYLFYAIPYLLVAILGMRSAKDEHFLNKLLSMMVVCFVLIQGIALYDGSGFSPNVDKYPPRAYYLTYGLLVSVVLYKLLPDKTHNVIKWTSINSFAIYLVHIIVLLGVNMTADMLGFKWLENWLLKFVIVITASVLITTVIEKVKLRSFLVTSCSRVSAKNLK